MFSTKPLPESVMSVRCIYESSSLNFYLILIGSYRQTSNNRRTLVGNKIVDHSDVVGAWHVGAAPSTFFILNLTPGFNGLGKDNCKTSQELFKFCDLVWLILEILRYAVPLSKMDHVIMLLNRGTIMTDLP